MSLVQSPRRKDPLAPVSLAGPALLAVALILSFVDILHGYFDHDAGYFFLESMYIARGMRPYLDFMSLYPPLFEMLNAVPIALGADRGTLIWAVPLFWIGVIGLLTQRYWARRTGGGGWFMAALFPLFCIDFGGNHYTLEHGVVFFGLVALVVFERKDARAFCLAGLALGCAALCKQVGILFLVPFVTQIRDRRQLGALVAGLVSVPFLCLAWIGFNVTKIIASMQELAGYVDHSKPKSIAGLWRMFVWIMGTEWHRTPPGLALIGATFVLGLLSLHRLARADSGEKRTRQTLWVGAWFCVGLVTLGARLINWFPHYTLNFWPALVVLCAESVEILKPWFRRFVVCLMSLTLASTMLFLLPVLRDVQSLPYFYRWVAPDLLHTRFLPISEEIRRLVPEEVKLDEQGVTRKILLFLSDRMPKRLRWLGANLIDTPPDGRFVLYITEGQKETAEEIARIERAGYKATGSWRLLRETTVLFQRP